MIKRVCTVGGYNVHLREVEEVLNEHLHIFEVAVVGVPHQDTGEAIIGFVSANNSITEETLIYFCKKNLANYKVLFKIKILDQLPMSTTGKVIKKIFSRWELIMKKRQKLYILLYHNKSLIIKRRSDKIVESPFYY